MNNFLALDDAVKIAVREFGADEEIARTEFYQKCRIPDDAYRNGCVDGLHRAKFLIDEEWEEENLRPVRERLTGTAKKESGSITDVIKQNRVML